MTTTIQSNGSRWAGEQPATINELFEVLETHALDRTFEAFGNFVMVEPISEHGVHLVPNGVRFWGNFAELSHVFSVDTDDADLIERLTAAIRKNQQRPDYLSQRTYEEEQAKIAAYRAVQDQKRQAERERHARITLGLPAVQS